jgi:hypothetical protein
MRLVRLGSGLTVVLLGVLLVALWRRDVRRSARHRTA